MALVHVGVGDILVQIRIGKAFEAKEVFKMALFYRRNVRMIHSHVPFSSPSKTYACDFNITHINTTNTHAHAQFDGEVATLFDIVVHFLIVVS